MYNLWKRRSGVVIRGLFACAAIVSMVGTASANDGLQNFFSSMFGGGQAQPAQQAAPQQYEGAPVEPGSRTPGRPLTVKLHRPKSRIVQGPPTRPGKVSIFEDKTLRRGDAVMTNKGMRIFAGSRSWPYRDEDFVAVADAGRMDKEFAQTLIALDRLPRR